MIRDRDIIVNRLGNAYHIDTGIFAGMIDLAAGIHCAVSTV